MVYITLEVLKVETCNRCKEGMANQYGNLGNVHQTRGELEQAVQMYEKALTINGELGRQEGMASSYANLGVVHETLGELWIRHVCLGSGPSCFFRKSTHLQPYRYKRGLMSWTQNR